MTNLTPSTVTRAAPDLMVRPAAHTHSFAWVLRRALLGLTLLSVFAVGGAFLLDATIDRDQDAASASEE